MKRLITILALFAAFSARADERGDAIVARMSAAVGAIKHYEIKFVVSADGMDAEAGVVIVSGARYNIQIFGNEQFSDGRYKYDIVARQKEVVIDRIDAASHNILNNPARAFTFAASEFNTHSLSATKVELTPKTRTAGVGKIILSVNVSTGLPTELIYDYDGQQITIAITSFAALQRVDEALFRYAAAKYRGWEVVDFR